MNLPAPRESFASVELSPREGDDPAFIDRVGAIFEGALRASAPAELWIVRIDGFFDARWFRFAGKMLGALGVHTTEELVLPPFHPHRVVDETRVVDEARVVTRAGASAQHAARLHRAQPSEANLQNVLTRGDRSAAFLWFSSESAQHGVASAMSYVVDGADSAAWYASFAADAGC